SRSVADGAVRKMSVVPDANGRDHRREEEQSDDQTADRCGVVDDDGRGGDTRRGLRFSEAPPSRLVPCPPPTAREATQWTAQRTCCITPFCSRPLFWPSW